ncbi:urease accessory protein UreE [Campylobacter blaseri]|uniref:Urease accessory protein UreE n=1 Tax=Campylobacter blaseri TaxID=2042961 RepID=A0A2P8QYZ0_9BACT|nr:urease accessory protein UreE [Campylobacter blaseri]PSM51452.1 urease accessory protein UreE [Campylobacter blaseri]PSM52901.1 urease accessory protein UreE [Campylobacter blaseri]QKF86544.1 urease accessory protein UreE [Campylobacter blaseri]
MIINKVLDNEVDSDFSKYKTIYATMPFDHSHKRIQKLKADDGMEFHFMLDEDVRVRGLNHGDIFFRDEKTKTQYAIKIAEILCLVIKVKNSKDRASIGYVIGNRHAKVYFGDNVYELLTPYEKTMEDMLSQIKEVKVSKGHRVLLPEKSLMAILPNSQEPHSHDH